MEIFWVPFAIALAFPARWSLRIGIAAVLVCAEFVYLTPAMPWEQYQGFDGLSAVVAVIFFLAVVTGVALRIIAELIYARPLLWRGNHWLRGTDLLLSSLTGVLSGTIATLAMAITFSGQSGGLALHLCLAAFSAGLAAVFLVWAKGIFRPFLFATSGTVALLILLGGVSYPGLIKADALRLHPGHPRCLRTPDLSPPLRDELRLLTLPQAQPFIAGLTLTVMLPDGPQHFRWSYRSLQFRTYNSATHGACPQGSALQ
jgi:hypothetical protein